ncbi:FHA domain-containing protein [Thermocoleostomius sinensis]|uniref:FHA domain-containing protein n=1 Tax=Thermocoleostomius sinensis A174 TaxID=2016057 RepID=A0A9E9CBT5_9CYAN|nr:FHA domain-containing protein [Thermocoleostomius sinensis]WAL61115.1 FHA domain-containing protein [Thermocoleostomius sinensis A174]
MQWSVLDRSLGDHWIDSRFQPPYYKMLLNPSDSSSNCSNPSFQLLAHQPALSESLLDEYELEDVSALMAPVLKAPQRCQRSKRYIQAVTAGCVAFLATNAIEPHVTEVTPVSSSWLIGRSRVCAIQVPHKSVSRCHAVIGHYPSGFYITDLGSLNGTWVNEQRLNPADRTALKDGDLIQFGAVQVEFFLSIRGKMMGESEETIG